MSDSFVGALALVRRFIDGTCEWMFVQDEETLRLPQAERLEGESYRESIEREVAWLLRLNRGKDYIVSSVPRAHFQGPISLCDHDTFYVVEFYVVDFFGKSAQETVKHNPDLRWLAGDQVEDVLRARKTEHTFAPIHRELLRRTEVIRPDASN